MEMHGEPIYIKDYNYDLPQDKIASVPLTRRDSSKLLVYRSGTITDDLFIQIDQHIAENELVILNNTRVIEARILFTKSTGGVIEIFCLEPFEESMEQSLASITKVRWLCLIGGASKWKPGQVLEKPFQIPGAEGKLFAEYKGKIADSFIIEFSWHPPDQSFSEILHAAGAIPLPPYIRRSATDADKVRYQTIFGKQEGSVAAPTAALHFTDHVFSNLRKKDIFIDYITLHVGAGTFKPVKTETVAEHEMHREPFTISVTTLRQILALKKITAVGTTTLRTLESTYWMGVKVKNHLIRDHWNLDQWEAYELQRKYGSTTVEESLTALLDRMEQQQWKNLHCSTSLIIVPGYQFKIAEALVTNFHQPQSTLLLLVSAFVGEDWKKIYRHALEKDYRFLSYGDCSLLWRGTNN